MVCFFFISLFPNQFINALIYKIGIEKARIAVFVVVFGFLIIFNCLANYIDFNLLLEKVNSLIDWWFMLILIIAILFILVSYLITSKIYLKKEI